MRFGVFATFGFQIVAFWVVTLCYRPEDNMREDVAHRLIFVFSEAFSAELFIGYSNSLSICGNDYTV